MHPPASLVPILVLILSTSLPGQVVSRGRSSETSEEGLAYELITPGAGPQTGKPSLMVILHGAGGTATGMASALAFLAEQGFVVVAPKSRGQVWSRPDVDDVRALVPRIVKRTGADPTRLHCAGFSNGGWNLAPLAFDPKLKFLSATWVAAGCKGGRPPRGAEKRMGVLALAGADDANRGAAEQTPKMLGRSVKRAEVRLQPGLGHEWPRKLMPYLRYWLECLEGRCTAGRDLSFDWLENLEEAREKAARQKRGVLLYLFTREEAATEDTRRLQNEAFFDPRVRFYGDQLVALKLEAAGQAGLMKELGVKKLPAVVVLSRHWKRPKRLQGKIGARKLASALRSVARRKEMPRR